MKYARLAIMLLLISMMAIPAQAQSGSGHLLRSIHLDIGTINDSALSPDGTTLALATPNGLWLYDLSDPNAEAQPFGDFGGFINRVTFSPDGSVIAADEERQIELIHLLDAATGQTILLLDDDDNDAWVGDLVFSSDGTRLVSGNHSTHIKVWDTQTGEQLHLLIDHNREVMGLAFSPDGSRLASASFDRTLRVWDTSTYENVFVLRGHTNRLTSVDYSPDGRWIATGSADRTARIWDATTGEVIYILEGHTARVETVAFSPDGSILVTAGRDNTIRLWDTASGACLDVLEGHTWWVVRLVFQDDHTLISVGGNGEIRIWDISPL
jgi:WD40 repeat protein